MNTPLAMLPAIDRPGAMRTMHSGVSGKDRDQEEAIASLCKTYNATVSKLIYAFAGLKAQDDTERALGGKQTKSVSDAIASGKRGSLMEKIASALSSGVERVVRCEDVSLRAGVTRDLRARFAPVEKAETCDAGAPVSYTHLTLPTIPLV